jgi:hypothetical protein
MSHVYVTPHLRLSKLRGGFLLSVCGSVGVGVERLVASPVQLTPQVRRGRGCTKHEVAFYHLTKGSGCPEVSQAAWLMRHTGDSCASYAFVSTEDVLVLCSVCTAQIETPF